mmetsp:Transcript_98944/g.284251  ORF Transcript_98944/g.284251 Transcript_98944/m.284251 type:complete len:521 (+) Transcript_98944:1685-3247(+)
MRQGTGRPGPHEAVPHNLPADVGGHVLTHMHWVQASSSPRPRAVLEREVPSHVGSAGALSVVGGLLLRPPPPPRHRQHAARPLDLRRRCRGGDAAARARRGHLLVLLFLLRHLRESSGCPPPLLLLVLSVDFEGEPVAHPIHVLVVPGRNRQGGVVPQDVVGLMAEPARRDRCGCVLPGAALARRKRLQDHVQRGREPGLQLLRRELHAHDVRALEQAFHGLHELGQPLRKVTFEVRDDDRLPQAVDVRPGRGSQRRHLRAAASPGRASGSQRQKFLGVFSAQALLRQSVGNLGNKVRQPLAQRRAVELGPLQHACLPIAILRPFRGPALATLRLLVEIHHSVGQRHANPYRLPGGLARIQPALAFVSVSVLRALASLLRRQGQDLRKGRAQALGLPRSIPLAGAAHQGRQPRGAPLQRQFVLRELWLRLRPRLLAQQQARSLSGDQAADAGHLRLVFAVLIPEPPHGCGRPLPEVHVLLVHSYVEHRRQIFLQHLCGAVAAAPGGEPHVRAGPSELGVT